MSYVDGYVIPIPKKNIEAYRRVAKKAGKIWREHGASQYCECVGEDLKVKWGVPFPKTLKSKPAETVIFCFVVFKSRAHRDKVNTRVMKDKRLSDMAEECATLFDCKRVVYGGFRVLVDA
jgi:uncharacterized protein YbaA (DUF1428 family)